MPDLARLIDEIRVLAPVVVGDQVQQVELLPDGTMGLLFRVTEGSIASRSRRGDLSVVGTRTRALYKTVPSVPLALFVRFRPGIACAILGIPANELTDRVVRLEDLWGSKGAHLCDGLLSACGIEEMLEVLRGVLDARAMRVRESPSARIAQHAVGFITKSVRPVRIAELAASIGVTTRHLRRVFTGTVGIGPKEFSRVVRFRRAVHAATSERSWTRVAVDAGYYDQAHMIKDFRELVGTTPTAFVTRQLPQPSFHWNERGGRQDLTGETEHR